MQHQEKAKEILIKLRDKCDEDKQRLFNTPKEINKLRRLGIRDLNSLHYTTSISEKEIKELIDFYNEATGESENKD